MKIYCLHTKQILKNTDLEKAWKFFSNPKNLNKITPESMNFKILDEVAEDIYPGMLIKYKIQPFLFFQTQWITEITACKKNEYFIDEQRFGPYKFWHHLHKFEQINNDVLMRDELNYILPAGLFHFLISSIVSKKIHKIFNYRYEKLEELFNQ